MGPAPSSERVREEAWRLCESGQLDRALSLLRSAIGTDLEHARTLGCALEDLGRAGEALELTTEAACVRDPELACLRARWALRTQQADIALAEADIALELILQRGISVPEFVRLAIRNAPSEILLRFQRRDVARAPSLQQPLTLRWEALRRAGRRAEAREMRAACLKLFPERASVWAEAGNQALDESDFERAEAYFDRCLSLDANWSAAIAGKAIVFETRKDWPSALACREKVVHLEDALARDDPASLHRLARYAAALGRVGRWDEAEALFRRCALRGVTERVPAERPVFERVFSNELYAPAVFATLHRPQGGTAPTPHALLALHEARLFSGAYAALRDDTRLEPAEKLRLLGMTAWLAGDYERAYLLLDEAEVEREGDASIQCLLAWSARAIGAPEREAIERFALAAAREVLTRASRAETVAAVDHACALATVRRSGALHEVSEREPHVTQAGDVSALIVELVAHRVSAASPLQAALDTSELLATLERALPNARPSLA